MTDNNSYGRLQLWAVTVPYKSLQLRSKISVERRERTSHHEPCGRRARDLCSRLAKIFLARDGRAAAFTPFVCFSKLCVLGYFAMSSRARSTLITQHLTVHLCFVCGNSICFYSVYEVVSFWVAFSLEVPKRLYSSWFCVLLFLYSCLDSSCGYIGKHILMTPTVKFFFCHVVF